MVTHSSWSCRGTKIKILKKKKKKEKIKLVIVLRIDKKLGSRFIENSTLSSFYAQTLGFENGGRGDNSWTTYGEITLFLQNFKKIQLVLGSVIVSCCMLSEKLKTKIERRKYSGPAGE